MTRSPIFLASAPAPSTAAVSTTIWRWNSATPYLLGGIVLVMMLIAVAMLMLVCSIRRENRRSAAAVSGEKSVKGADFTGSSVPVPEFVVIMAGDEKPTFLAMPTLLPATNFPAGGEEPASDLTAR